MTPPHCKERWEVLFLIEMAICVAKSQGLNHHRRKKRDFGGQQKVYILTPSYKNVKKQSEKNGRKWTNEESMSLTKTRHSVRTFALFVCWFWSSFLGCAAKRSSSFLHPSLHIVLTCSSPCLLGFPPQTLKSCVPSPLFYLAQKLSSALGLAFSMCTGAEQQKELDGKGIHKGIHVTVFTRQWFLLFQSTDSIFPKRTLWQVTGMAWHPLLTVPSLPTNSVWGNCPIAHLELRQQFTGLGPHFFQVATSWTRDKHLI